MRLPFIAESYYEMFTKWVMISLSAIAVLSAIIHQTWNAIAFFAGLVAVYLIGEFTGSSNQSIFGFQSAKCGSSVLPWTTVVYAYTFSYLWYTITAAHTAVYNMMWIIAGAGIWAGDAVWLLSAKCYGLPEVGAASIVGLAIGLLWAKIVYSGEGSCVNTGKRGPSSMLFRRLDLD